MRAVLFAFVFAIAALGAAGFFFRPLDKIVHIPTAAHSGYSEESIDIGDLGVDAGVNCPLGLDANAQGQVAVINSDGSKAFLIDPKKKSSRAVLLEGARGGVPVAASFEDDGIFLLKQAFDAGSIMSDFVAPADRDEGGAFRPPSLPPKPSLRALRRFKPLGFDPVAGDGYLRVARTQRSVEKRRIDSGEFEFAQGDGRLVSVFFEVFEGNELAIETAYPDRSIVEKRFIADRPVVEVRPVGVDSEGGVFIAVTEEQGRTGPFRSEQTVVRFPKQKEAPLQLFFVPRSTVCIPQQNIALAGDGRVVALVVKRDYVSVGYLRPHGPWAADLRWVAEVNFANAARLLDRFSKDEETAPPAILATPQDQGEEKNASITALESESVEGANAASANDNVEVIADAEEEFETVVPDPVDQELTTPEDPYAALRDQLFDEYNFAPEGGVLTRRDVVENACAFLKVPWTVEKSHYDPKTSFCVQHENPNDPCAGNQSCGLPYWTRPNRLNGELGNEVLGTAYAWGGADFPWGYLEKLQSGRPAGDVCTKGVIFDASSPSTTFSAGVDCSGFVTRSWGFREGKYATSTLHQVADPIAYEEMRPGDILNKAGNHVRIFLYWSSPSEITFIESSTNCGGVCVRTLPRTSFEGYQAMRFREIGDDGAGSLSPNEIDSLCAVSVEEQ